MHSARKSSSSYFDDDAGMDRERRDVKAFHFIASRDRVGPRVELHLRIYVGLTDVVVLSFISFVQIFVLIAVFWQWVPFNLYSQKIG